MRDRSLCLGVFVVIVVASHIHHKGTKIQRIN